MAEPETLPDPIPAATLVIFRDRAGGPPELLIVERAAAMAFAGGALVFPGGRVDPGDRALALRFGGEAEDTAARIAAIRETLEEAGVPIGFAAMPSADALARMRAALHDGEGFGAVLAEGDATIDPHSLVSFARWLPQHRHLRIFDTRFYLGRLPEDAPLPEVDQTENSRVFWATAQGVLDEADAGRAKIIFPTRRNLERLALYADFAEASTDAAAHPVRTITPWTEQRDGSDWLCIPGDQGYPVTAEALASAMRA